MRIEVLQSISGVVFEDRWPRRCWFKVDNIDIPLIALKDLLKNKIASGRAQDLVDVEKLS